MPTSFSRPLYIATSVATTTTVTTTASPHTSTRPMLPSPSTDDALSLPSSLPLHEHIPSTHLGRNGGPSSYSYSFSSSVANNRSNTSNNSNNKLVMVLLMLFIAIVTAVRGGGGSMGDGSMLVVFKGAMASAAAGDAAAEDDYAVGSIAGERARKQQKKTSPSALFVAPITAEMRSQYRRKSSNGKNKQHRSGGDASNDEDGSSSGAGVSSSSRHRFMDSAAYVERSAAASSRRNSNKYYNSVHNDADYSDTDGDYNTHNNNNKYADDNGDGKSFLRSLIKEGHRVGTQLNDFTASMGGALKDFGTFTRAVTQATNSFAKQISSWSKDGIVAADDGEGEDGGSGDISSSSDRRKKRSRQKVNNGGGVGSADDTVTGPSFATNYLTSLAHDGGGAANTLFGHGANKLKAQKEFDRAAKIQMGALDEVRSSIATQQQERIQKRLVEEAVGKISSLLPSSSSSSSSSRCVNRKALGFSDADGLSVGDGDDCQLLASGGGGDILIGEEVDGDAAPVTVSRDSAAHRLLSEYQQKKSSSSSGGSSKRKHFSSASSSSQQQSPSRRHSYKADSSMRRMIAGTPLGRSMGVADTPSSPSNNNNNNNMNTNGDGDGDGGDDDDVLKAILQGAKRRQSSSSSPSSTNGGSSSQFISETAEALSSTAASSIYKRLYLKKGGNNNIKINANNKKKKVSSLPSIVRKDGTVIPPPTDEQIAVMKGYRSAAAYAAAMGGADDAHGSDYDDGDSAVDHEDPNHPHTWRGGFKMLDQHALQQRIRDRIAREEEAVAEAEGSHVFEGGRHGTVGTHGSGGSAEGLLTGSRGGRGRRGAGGPTVVTANANGGSDVAVFTAAFIPKMGELPSLSSEEDGGNAAAQQQQSDLAMHHRSFAESAYNPGKNMSYVRVFSAPRSFCGEGLIAIPDDETADGVLSPADSPYSDSRAIFMCENFDPDTKQPLPYPTSSPEGYTTRDYQIKYKAMMKVRSLYTVGQYKHSMTDAQRRTCMISVAAIDCVCASDAERVTNRQGQQICLMKTIRCTMETLSPNATCAPPPAAKSSPQVVKADCYRASRYDTNYTMTFRPACAASGAGTTALEGMGMTLLPSNSSQQMLVLARWATDMKYVHPLPNTPTNYSADGSYIITLPTSPPTTTLFPEGDRKVIGNVDNNAFLFAPILGNGTWNTSSSAGGLTTRTYIPTPYELDYTTALVTASYADLRTNISVFDVVSPSPDNVFNLSMANDMFTDKTFAYFKQWYNFNRISGREQADIETIESYGAERLARVLNGREVIVASTNFAAITDDSYFVGGRAYGEVGFEGLVIRLFAASILIDIEEGPPKGNYKAPSKSFSVVLIALIIFVAFLAIAGFVYWFRGYRERQRSERDRKIAEEKGDGEW